MSAQQLITDHLDLWTGAVTHKSGSRRGTSGKNGKIELTGIKKLRELILELAVRGKLVEQDPNDEPASVLLEKIAEEKARLVKEGKVKKANKLPAITEEEKPFELPYDWGWARLGNISQINPRNNADDEIPASFIPMPMIKTSYHGDHEQEIRSWVEIKKGYTHFADGDIAIAKITPCFENSKAAVFRNLENGIGAGTTELHVARPYGTTLNPLYVLLCLKSPRFLSNGEKKMTGSAGQKRVPKDFFAGEPLPFPPLAEQHRIVEKVDELMALCDRLEQQVGDQLEAHEVLVDTLLDALTRSANAAEVAENWARIAEHFDTLFTTEASIDKLKQTILQLAVMGLLVEQDAGDEPGEETLKVISSWQTETSNAILKKRKKLGPLSDSEIPFTLPKGWEWVRFVDIALEYSVGLDKGKNQQAENNQYRYFKMNNILNNGGFQLDDIVSVDATKEEVSRYSLSSGDFLFNTRNSQELVGKTCVYTHDEGKPVLYNNNILRAKFRSTAMAYFVDIWMRSCVGKSKLEGLKSGTTNVWAIYQGKLETLPCPLPPLKEQRRIVEKVDELMALCDQLKASLNEADETHTQLAETVVEQAVS